jgi:mono/diheme cytochrome c family protein
VKRALAILLALFATTASALVVWPIGTRSGKITLIGDAANGAYLARVAGCIACHTDFEGDGAPLAGGVKIQTDFGVFVTPNITPDPQFGIGNWDVDDFAKAVRQGVSKSGKPYYPAFPYSFFEDLSDQEIADLWAAFRSVPSVAKPATRHALSFPYNLRQGLKLWRAMYPAPALPQDNPKKSEAWNRGQYLVNGPGHCGACHTPRDENGALVPGQNLRGSSGVQVGTRIPDISWKALWENYWSVESMKYALKTGIMQNLDLFDGSMAVVVRESTSRLSEQDRTAMALYLMDMNRE